MHGRSAASRSSPRASLLLGLELIEGAEGVDATLLGTPELAVQVIEASGGLASRLGLEAFLLNAEEMTRHACLAGLEFITALCVRPGQRTPHLGSTRCRGIVYLTDIADARARHAQIDAFAKQMCLVTIGPVAIDRHAVAVIELDQVRG